MMNYDDFINSVDKKAIALARKFYPWSKNLSDEEVIAVLAQCRVWGLNPSDAKEVTVSDQHGTISVEPGYRVMINWLGSMGRHSKIDFKRLVGDALTEQGVTNTKDIVIRASVVMYDEMRELLAMGFSHAEAREMSTHTGVGRVAAAEYLNGKTEKAYGSPNGRSPSFNAEKRARTALISGFGTPTPEEIRSISMMNRSVALEDRHFENTHALAPGDSLALATARATREQTPALTVADTNAATAAMFGGDSVPQIIDAEPIAQEPATQQPPQSQPAQLPARPWQPEQVREFVIATAAADKRPEPEPDSLANLRGRVFEILFNIFIDRGGAEACHAVMAWAAGETESKKLNRVQLSAIARWLLDFDAPDKPLRATAEDEARAVYFLTVGETETPQDSLF